MDTLLLVVTVVSLVVAAIMSFVAWRLARVERERSAARVAALAAAAETPAPASAREHVDEGWISERDQPAVVNASTGVASAAQWTPARVSTFVPASTAHESHVSNARSRRAHAAAPLAEPDDPPPVEAADRRLAPAALRAALGESFLHDSVAAPASGRQRGLALAACVLFVVLVTAGYWTIYGGGSSAAAVNAAAPAAPLELVSLTHERRGSELAVTGLVRNPAAGSPVQRLAAVVFLFDQEGRFVTSARSEVDFTMLTPGDESPFVVSLTAPPTVARYRVSFRTDAGVVPHIDRRGQEPIAREVP